MASRGNALRGMDLNLLKAFDALMQERNVTRAAERLGVTQPSASAALARLRLLFGDELLVKSGREMRATPFAERIAERIHTMLLEVEDIVTSHEDFDPHQDEQTFRVMVTDYTALILMGPVARTLAAEAPHVRLELVTHGMSDHADRLHSGEVDLAVVPDRLSRHSGLPREELFVDEFALAGWRGNPRITDSMTIADFTATPYLSFSVGSEPSMVDSLLTELGHDTRANVLVASFVTGPLLLRGTGFVTFIQRRLADLLAESAELRVVSPPFEIPPLLETLTWHPRSTTDPGHRWLRKQIVAAAAAL
ncbi:LysR family transcriptional regulator [Baekduia sp. Peel2402]|uniref:LysR family transcriptional regulator n=1 Tax=Baekduia sp. Peel2402 TaxID=3458296 RepID=UPI00403EBA82